MGNPMEISINRDSQGVYVGPAMVRPDSQGRGVYALRAARIESGADCGRFACVLPSGRMIVGRFAERVIRIAYSTLVGCGYSRLEI